MPPTLVLDIKRVILEMRSTRRSQEGSTSMIKIVRRPLGVVVGATGVFMGGPIQAGAGNQVRPNMEEEL
jgi:hypothetical protein